MSRIKTEHQGVSFRQKVNGGTYFLIWRDPRSFNRQRNDSSETNVFESAHRIAVELSRLIRFPELWKDPPADFHSRTLQIFGCTSATNIADLALDRLPEFPKPKQTDDIKVWADWFLKSAPRSAVITLLETLNRVTDERNRYRDELKIYKARDKRSGQKILVEQVAKPLKEALSDYLDSPTGSGASGAFRKNVEYWLKRFVHSAGDTKNVFDVEPEYVIKHLLKFLKTNTARNVDQIKDQLCRFLRFATKKNFAEDEVKAVLKPIIEKRCAETDDEEWYWLELDDVFLLVEHLRIIYGDYWADAALIQYAIACRPEEIPLLCTSNVEERDGKTFIKIDRIVGEKHRVLRRVKTKRSREAHLNVPQFAMEALVRRKVRGEYLLFPYDKESGVRLFAKKTLSPEELRLGLWPSADDKVFSDVYRIRLREAADMAGLKRALIDCRILRRTAARELVLAYGFEVAATYIRDSVETLRKHYADLRPCDVSGER